jgi:acyl-CoA synthetase (AMP-forming)/AMP-acid ligase II
MALVCDVEIEGALLRHPAVQEVAIVGMPDERWGEAPHAFVVLKAGATATETELRNYARDHLAHFKCPQKIRCVHSHAITPTPPVYIDRCISPCCEPASITVSSCGLPFGF